MQRIPNPGADIDIFIRIFRELHEELKNKSTFTLDDITHAMIKRNNVTSQGAIGDEALRRSTRKDRSRDPLFNQSKMYAELFRILGWIQSTTKKLVFTFSLLGEHVARASDPNPILRECLLNIAIPNEVLGAQVDQKVRVISTILLTMNELGDISRDELMGGPMSMSDDTRPQLFKEMVERLSSCRKRPGSLDKVIDNIAAKRRITRSPTMENYTRFPIAIFPWSGWAVKSKPGVLSITETGQAMALRLRKGKDYRLENFLSLEEDAKPAFIRWTFYKMLERNLSITLGHPATEFSVLFPRSQATVSAY